MEQTVTVDDGSDVRLGSTVWCNHVAGWEGPTECKLIAVFWRGDEGRSSWPWLVEKRDKDGTLHRYRWAAVYATREAALRTHTMPELAALRERLEELENKIAKTAGVNVDYLT